MRTDRRFFLKIAGFCLLGLGGRTALGGLAGQDRARASSLAQPSAAKQWGMVIDLPRCVQAGECTDCVAACHRAHNVPHFDSPKEEIKWAWKEPYPSAFPDSAHQFTASSLAEAQVLVMCNHCENPACVRVCPTGATWRREDGIAMMDEHRCIGCRYCVVGCPYGSRSFNWQDPRPYIRRVNPEFPTRTRGVVEKCNFCVDRLAQGRLPACVEACRGIGVGALAFGDLGDSSSTIAASLRSRFSIRRKSHLGTSPHVFYIV